MKKLFLSLFSLASFASIGQINPSSFPEGGLYEGTVIFKDLNGDSRPDLFMTGQDFVFKGKTELFLNSGNGYLSPKENPFEKVWESSAAFADIDGDHDQDLLLTGRNDDGERITKLYLNAGKGDFFELKNTGLPVMSHSSVAFTDFDNDGDQDIILSGNSYTNINGKTENNQISKTFFNDGKGNFSEHQELEGFYLGSLLSIDLNNDNYSDLILSGSNGNSQSYKTNIYLNDGNGNLIIADSTTLQGVIYSSIDYSDVENDGDFDIIITGLIALNQSYSALYLNNGSGSFSKDESNSFIQVDTGTARFIDIDNDSDEDLVISGGINSSAGKVYLNDANGQFTETSVYTIESIGRSAMDVSDIDGDGDLDFIISGTLSTGKPTASIYYNYASTCVPVYATQTHVAASSFEWIDGITYTSSTNSATHLSQNSQGCDSLITLNLTIENSNTAIQTFTVCDSLVWIDGYTYCEDNDFSTFALKNAAGGDSVVTLNLTILDPSYSTDSHTAYDSFTWMDGETYTSDTSIATYTLKNQMGCDSIISLNLNIVSSIPDSLGFVEQINTPFEGVAAGSSNLFDMDGDGDLDLIISGRTTLTNFAERITVTYKNNGFGDFIIYNNPNLPHIAFSSIKVGDVDGDGDLDLLLSGSNNSKNLTELYLNDGLGNFTLDSRNTLPGIDNASIDLVDLNNDSSLDLIISGRVNHLNYITQMYFNDGTGFFTQSSIFSTDGLQYSSITTGDINADNSMDFLISGSDASNEKFTKLFVNDGFGNFTQSLNTPFVNVSQSASTFFDADNDNDLDLIMSGVSSDGSHTILYRNDGLGNFSIDSSNKFTPLRFSAISTADIDNDGDIDFVISGWDENNQSLTETYLNNGSGKFQNYSNSIFENVAFGSFAIGDIDNNSRLDLFLTGSTNINFSKLYKNFEMKRCVKFCIPIVIKKVK